MFPDKAKKAALETKQPEPSKEPCEKETKQLHETCFLKWNNCDILFETYQSCMRRHYNLPS